MFLLQLLQSCEQVIPDLQRVFLQLLALDDLQDRLTLRTNDRVAAEGVEMNPFRKHARDLWCRHNGGQWTAVSDAFSHCNDVWNYPLRLEALEIVPRAPE